MGKARRLAVAGAGLTISERVIGAIRPGVEALLLGAVALGVAQAGWAALTPDVAGASGASSSEDTIEPRLSATADVRSPFAADAVVDAESHAAAALLSGLQLTGVRVAAEPGASGAVLTMADGAQRAFGVGDEIASGVRLADVGAGYVLLAYDGGQRQLTLATPQGYSFARALMGQEQIGVTQSQPAVAVVTAPPASAQAAAYSPVLDAAGRVRGWRIEQGAPSAITGVGLAVGDVVVSINGAPLRDMTQALASLAAGGAELGVERAGALMTLSVGRQSPA